jgi:hypothetical protein
VISLRGGSTAANVQVQGGERGLGTQAIKTPRRRRRRRATIATRTSCWLPVLFEMRSRAVLLSIWWRRWRKWASGPWRRRTAQPR